MEDVPFIIYGYSDMPCCGLFYYRIPDAKRCAYADCKRSGRTSVVFGSNRVIQRRVAPLQAMCRLAAECITVGRLAYDSHFS